MFLGERYTLTVIIASDLEPFQVDDLKVVVKKSIQENGWTITDNIRIALGICFQNIKLEENDVPSVENQMRLNQPMQQVVKK